MVGTNDPDMATAVNHINAMQGGYVLVDAGTVVADLPMPVFGLIADLPLESIADRVTRLERALANRGVTVTRIARGIPVGADLENADDLTLTRALEGRVKLD